MQVEFSVTLLWSLANNLTFWAAALLTNSTLTLRRNAGQTFLGWVTLSHASPATPSILRTTTSIF